MSSKQFKAAHLLKQSKQDSTNLKTVDVAYSDIYVPSARINHTKSKAPFISISEVHLPNYNHQVEQS